MTVNFEFESASSAAALLNTYDPDTDTWSFPQSGDFWNAVSIAHQNGLRGKGCKIAIIDSACDLIIPKLQRQSGGRAILAADKSESAEHGTAVALLAATVAPEADLDIYEISKHGRPDPFKIEQALKLASQSDANIICLSFGVPQKPDLSKYLNWIQTQVQSGLTQFVEQLIKEGRVPKPEILACQSPVCICKAVNSANTKGKKVVASVGNTKGELFCPARAEGAFAIGYQLDQREVVNQSWEAAKSADPTYSQSEFVDFTIMQPENVLGSSFAAPLIAGALALGFAFSDVNALILSSKIGAMADSFMGDWYGNGCPNEPLTQSYLRYLYVKAIEINPYFPETKSMQIPGAAIFTASFMINGGLFFLIIEKYDLAQEILAWCRKIAPYSCHAAANLGKVYFLKALALKYKNPIKAKQLAIQASHEYDSALALRQNFSPYEREKTKIVEFLELI